MRKYTKLDATFIELISITTGIIVGALVMLVLAYKVATAPAQDLDSMRPAFVPPQTVEICIKGAGCFGEITALDNLR